jgi:hypothetical protein
MHLQLAPGIREQAGLQTKPARYLQIAEEIVRMKLLDRIRYGKWKVCRTGWPYNEGYGSYLPRRNMLLDSGLTKERAQLACDELNEWRHKHNNA